MTKARNIADLGSNDVIETTATGVDVTGTITADGIQTDTSNTNFNLLARNSTNVSTYIQNGGSGDILQARAGSMDAGQGRLQFSVANNGDVSFYEDTGTTAKMVWDASAESLAIGTTADTGRVFHVKQNGNYPCARFEGKNGGYSAIEFSSHDNDATVGALSAWSGTVRIGHREASEIGVDTSKAIIIDSSGNVGIGTSSPQEELHIEANYPQLRIASDLNIIGSNNLTCTIDGHATDGRAWRIGRAFGSSDMQITNDRSSSMTFSTNSTERARLDSSGNLLVGKTSAVIDNIGLEIRQNGLTQITRDGNKPLALNRLTSDGTIIELYKDTSLVGSIISYAGLYTIYNSDNGSGFLGVDGVRMYGWDTYRIYPRTDNIRDLGSLSYRFDDIYATNGTIQTSDRNEKQDIEVLNEAEQRVAQACKGLLRKFRWKDSVAEKGDEARIHFGIIAQDLQDAFTAEGLDAGRYAMFISSTWTDEETGEERTRLGVRYPELLAFIISAL